MSTSATNETTYPIHLLGKKTGLVKNLPGFRKGMHKVPHTLPDSLFERQFPNMCAPELEQVANDLFDKLRTARSYKRKEISLNVSTDTPEATLTTIDFTLDVSFQPNSEEPREYRLIYDIHDIRDISIISHEALDTVFAGLLQSMRFDFPKMIQVEDVIDELEDLPGNTADLHYPPDASECTVQLQGFIGQLHITPTSLEVNSSIGCSPSELVKTFVRAMEVLEKNPALSQLIPKR